MEVEVVSMPHFFKDVRNCLIAKIPNRCSHSVRTQLDSTYDFERVSDDADGHELLAVVATVHHERVR